MKFLSELWIKKLVRDFKQQKLLFMTLIILCFFGTGSFIALTMGYTNLEISYQRVYEITNFADAEISTFNDIWFNESQMEALISEFMANHTQIQGINYRLILNTGYNVTSSSNSESRQFILGGRAIGVQLTDDPINGLIFESGSMSEAFSEHNHILLEAHFAQKFDLKRGDHLLTEIKNETFDFLINGVVFSPEYLIIIPSKHDFLPTSTFGIIYLPLDELQALTNLTGLSNNLVIKMKSGTSVSTRNSIVEKLFDVLSTHFPNSFSLPIFQENQNSNLGLRLDLETIEEIALILPTIVLGVAAISLYITLGRMIQSQRRIIGITNCLGYDPDDIFLHYVTLSLVIGIIGSISGLLVGIGLSGGITWIYAYYMRFPQIIEIKLQIPLILTGILTGLSVSVLSGAIPSWKASRMVPRETLQTDLSVEKGGYSILEKILIINPFGLRLTIPIRNLFRNRSRTIVTIIALTSSVMMLVVSLSFIESVGGGVYRQFNETSQYDIIVKYEGFKIADLGANGDVDYIQNLPGVVSVDPVLQVPSILYIDGKPQDVLITAWNSSTPSVHKFEWSSNNDSLWPNGSMVLCSSLAQDYNIKAGKTINYAYPQIPGVNLAYDGAVYVWQLWAYQGNETARIKILNFLEDLLGKSKESFSFIGSSEQSNIKMVSTPIVVSGVSKELWGSMVYTTIDTLVEKMGLEIFKRGLDIDMTPFSQLILKVDQASNLTLLEEIKSSISQLEGIRSIEFSYDFKEAVDTLMGVFNVIILLFLIFSIIFAGAAIFTTIYVNFQERRKEIATMLTLGLSDNEFLFIISIENLVQAIIGILLGMPIGLLLANWLFENIIRGFYFEINVQLQTWILLWVGVLGVVLISQIPAVYNGIKLDLGTVTKELAT